MGRDDNALVVPQARIGQALEFTVIDVQGDAAEFALSKSDAQSFFVDDLTARDVDQDRSRFHRGKSFSPNQVRRLLGPRTTNRHELALAKQIRQCVRAFQSRKARWKRGARSNLPARADH